MQLNVFSPVSLISPNILIVETGPPEEDELYEMYMVETNMVYKVIGEELVPYEEYWGTIPKFEMLDSNEVSP